MKSGLLEVEKRDVSFEFIMKPLHPSVINEKFIVGYGLVMQGCIVGQVPYSYIHQPLLLGLERRTGTRMVRLAWIGR